MCQPGVGRVNITTSQENGRLQEIEAKLLNLRQNAIIVTNRYTMAEYRSR